MPAESKDGRQAASERAGETRRAFVDPAGRVWQVFEAPYPAFDRRAGTCLVFASDEVVRRVRTFPSDWAELPDEELQRLSWNR